MRQLDKKIVSKAGSRYGLDFERILQQKETYDRLEKYLVSEKEPACPKKRETEQVIWMYWNDDRRIPKIVRRCMESVKRNADRPVIVLSEKTVNDYIELPEYIWEKYKKRVFSKTHFSDLLRVALLSAYGGTWIDATVFCTGKIPGDWLNSEFFLFQRGPWQLYASERYIRCSSWFITAGKNSRLIKESRNIMFRYWENEDTLWDYYLLHIAIGKLTDCKRECCEEWRNMPFADTQHPHYLGSVMREDFDDEGWRKIKQISNIHKLTCKSRIVNTESYFRKIMNDEIR